MKTRITLDQLTRFMERTAIRDALGNLDPKKMKELREKFPWWEAFVAQKKADLSP